jgi:bifunctional UDP-N-acetylglucosamine pyrophosphorylase/glucosamine-1-phosphate N-acetyltransferase
MISYVVEAARGAGAKTVIVVVGAGADQVQAPLPTSPT